MMALPEGLMEIVYLGGLAAEAPWTYGVKVLAAILAWVASLGRMGPVMRILGIGGLLAGALAFLFPGFLYGALIDFLLGILLLGAAAHSWARLGR